MSVAAVANIRPDICYQVVGGGEYGETWHEQGKLHNKLNSLNDTIAVAEFLIKNNYTQKELLTINGESNGGMSVAAVANIRPDICYQVVAECGVYDLLNFHKYPPGFYWKSEYGDPEKKEDMEYIKRYSPLHTIKKDIKYPIIILKTAQNDDRVNPIHSWLFYEALKKAFLGTKNKVYLRVNEVGGHGGSSLTSFIQDTAEYYACVLSTDKDSKINTTSKIL
jgi:prolyl oligopeptidase